MTNLLLLIGAGLFSKAVGSFETHAFNVFLGTNADDSGGDGPGSYPVAGNIWHLDCCNPENTNDGQGWSIFNAVLGWTNNATGTERRKKKKTLSLNCKNSFSFLNSSRNRSLIRVLLDCGHGSTCLHEI